ncbi:uncharacterized protein LOC122558093 [Chiloscyllium plagiosum]|uniref:uncharacterized protein LOC122558093 n=1 Tax=Chiloscyllium plagiosum TaxID=36176 RepID=UPI001CB838A8|nr:uncharacterized protein LOC122558093 [Chiloscyllium plagiosum]
MSNPAKPHPLPPPPPRLLLSIPSLGGGAWRGETSSVSCHWLIIGQSWRSGLYDWLLLGSVCTQCSAIGFAGPEPAFTKLRLVAPRSRERGRHTAGSEPCDWLVLQQQLVLRTLIGDWPPRPHAVDVDLFLSGHELNVSGIFCISTWRQLMHEGVSQPCVPSPQCYRWNRVTIFLCHVASTNAATTRHHWAYLIDAVKSELGPNLTCQPKPVLQSNLASATAKKNPKTHHTSTLDFHYPANETALNKNVNLKKNEEIGKER